MGDWREALPSEATTQTIGWVKGLLARISVGSEQGREALCTEPRAYSCSPRSEEHEKAQGGSDTNSFAQVEGSRVALGSLIRAYQGVLWLCRQVTVVQGLHKIQISGFPRGIHHYFKKQEADPYSYQS